MQLFSSWTGGDFLMFYTMLLGLGTLAAWWIPAQLREPGRRGESLEPEDLALLAGGRGRFVDSLLADLYVRGGLADGDKGKLVVAPVPPASRCWRRPRRCRWPMRAPCSAPIASGPRHGCSATACCCAPNR